ncbi:hypothetical protein O3794_02660 [Gemella sanguinis]|uniref:hypothetical protein n=1 Tax=Gemella sanguinis TaxID=84135 RepID=UPI00352E76A7
MDLEKVVIYDIEVFKYDFLLVFKNIKKYNVATFHNEVATQNFNPFLCHELGIKITTKDGKQVVRLEDIVRKQTLVGYNNYHYDDRVIQEITTITHRDIDYIIKRTKETNDLIIGNKYTTKFRHEFVSLDVFQEIDVSFPSLKMIEANKGVSIEETSVPFDIDRPLTKQELDKTKFYCNYDVDNTIEVYKERISNYFEPKIAIVESLVKKDKDFTRFIRFNTTTLVANKFKHKGFSHTKLVGTEAYSVVPKLVRDKWLDFQDRLFINVKKNNQAFIMGDEDIGVNLKDLDCELDFGKGGLHGVPEENEGCILVYNNVKLLDVASLYPTIIGNLRLLGKYTDEYIQMRLNRLAIKHTDKKLSNSLKLVLNKTYGILNNKYSAINNPFVAYSVCFYGQSLLYDLSKELHSIGCKLININTDGVAFTTDGEEYKEVWKRIEEKYNITLEEDRFTKWIQKDVNNYIAVKENGSVKVKGASFGKYKKEEVHNYRNYSLAIVDRALVDYLLYGTSPLNTVLKYREEKDLFQMILRCGGTFLGTSNENQEILPNKINRIFACSKNNPKRTKLYKAKQREDGTLSLANFPDTPDDMLVFNGNIKDLDSKEIDLSFYLRLIESKIQDLGQIKVVA